MLIKTLCLIFFPAVINTIAAQKGSIKGTIVDNQTLNPIEYASVAIINPSNQLAVAGALSTKTGDLSIKNIKRGTYIVKIYFIGYREQLYDNIKVENNQNVQLGAITLKIASQALDKVVVQGKKSNSYNKIYKQQYKVSQFETAKGGTAIDIIKNLLSVAVNCQGDISVRGSNVFLVLVNGKPVLTDAATTLSQLPANTIKNIELITAPSAKYDPDGKGGIINVVTTKGSTDGFALSTNVMGGLPSLDDYDNLKQPQQYNADITANYKKDKLDAALTLNYLRNDNNGYREGDVFTKDFEKNTISRFPSNGERSFDKHNYSLKTAVFYTLNSTNSFNFGFYLGKKFQARLAELNYNNSTLDLTTDAVISRSPYFNSNLQIKEGKFTLANKSTFTTSALYEHANLYGNTKNVNLNYEIQRTIFQEVYNPYYNPIFGIRFKLDYAIAIGNGKLEIGYEYRYDDQGGTFGYIVSPETVPPTDNAFFRGTAKTRNHNNSVYSQYSRKVEKLEFVGGLRYEYATREVDLSTDVNRHLLTFSNLFPSGNLLYSLNNSWNAKAGYSKRVQRNNNSELDPIPEREHSETLEQGDPDLLPQFVDLVELGVNHSFKKGTLFTTSYFQNILNPIQRVNSVYNDTILNRLYTNGKKARLYGLELGANLKPYKWLSFYLGANVYNYKIDGDLDVLGFTSTVNNANWVYAINSNSTINFDKTWSLTPM
ncbi:MAG: ferric enterobactin receptor [Flavobacteriales bacterium]|jgi:ferric enterobactin receptor